MTPRELFDRAYLRTLVAAGAKPDDDHAEECWRAVKGFRASLYDNAASWLNATTKFLPKPAEWRNACEVVQAEQDERDRANLALRYEQETGRATTYHCPVCRDTGWEPGLCKSGQLCGRCSRTVHLYDHPYVTECLCRATNPMYQAKRLRQQTTVQAPKRGRAD
jgi:recombinational DNA repair protein (RecF pathway)